MRPVSAPNRRYPYVLDSFNVLLLIICDELMCEINIYGASFQEGRVVVVFQIFFFSI